MPKLIDDLLNPKPAAPPAEKPAHSEPPRLSLRRLILDVLEAQPRHAFQAIEVAGAVHERLEKMIDRRRDPRLMWGWTALLFEETRDEGSGLLMREEVIWKVLEPLVVEGIAAKKKHEGETYFWLAPPSDEGPRTDPGPEPQA